jgi:hypothetical protein
MDANTFNVLGNGLGMASSSGLRIVAPYAACSPHECERGPECKKCLQAASASASFAEAMETLAKDRRIPREWQRILYVLKKLERRRLERRRLERRRLERRRLERRRLERRRLERRRLERRRLERRRLEKRTNSAGAEKLRDIWEVYWGRIGKANK